MLASCGPVEDIPVSPLPKEEIPSTEGEEQAEFPNETPSEQEEQTQDEIPEQQEQDVPEEHVDPQEEEPVEEEKPIQEEEEEKPVEEEEEKPIVEEEDDEDEQGLNLDEWQNWTFSDGNKPQYSEDWDFYYGTSFEPSGCLWENPKVEEYNGIEFFDKKQYLESPVFKSYPKVEVRFEFWFSSHQSNKYKATDNEPQFKIEEYDSKENSVGVDTIEIAKSDIPKNNTTREKRIYITNSKMTHFNLKFNNFIPNGDSGYTAILYKVSLKGWPQV